MTLSHEARSQAVEKTLSLLLRELGVSALDSVLVDPSAPTYAGLPQTTWTELEEQGLVERDRELEAPRYRLTGRGWIEALARSEQHDGIQLNEQLERLAAYLKAKVKGRHDPALLDMKTASHESSLSEEWIFNVIESNLLEVKFRRRGAHWHPRYGGRVIVVPITFGMEPVDASDRLRAKIEQLEEEVADRNERLSEFLCPYCGAPMSTQGPVEHQYGNSLYQSFECGYAATDGQINQPCPSSSNFPALEEFDFQCFELKDDGHWKWSCYAIAKTGDARLLRLPHGLGRTQEEAKNYVLEQYNRRARPWKR